MEDTGQTRMVAQGESVETLAWLTGFRSTSIWDHPRNADLAQTRGSMHILKPGDEVFIPAKRLREINVATERRHRVVRHVPTTELRIAFLKQDRPRANEDYVLVVDGKEVSGTTDGEGIVTAKVPMLAIEGRLRFANEPDQEYILALRHLDPVDTPTGIAARLANLGYRVARSPETVEECSAAISKFQTDHGLEANGQLDAATRSKLVEVHGS